MLFYKTFATLSILALGVLSTIAAPATAAVDYTVARCDCSTIPDILADVRVNIAVDVESLSKSGCLFDVMTVEILIYFTLEYLTKDNCTTEVVGPIVTNIKGVIADATVKVKALSNQPADIVLGVGVDITVVAGLISDLLNVCATDRYIESL